MIHTDKMLINFMWVIHDVVELKSEKTIETENQKTIKARNIRKSRKRKNVVSHLKKTNENSTNDVHYNKKKQNEKKRKTTMKCTEIMHPIWHAMVDISSADLHT